MPDQRIHAWLTKARRASRLDKLPPLMRKIVVMTVGCLLLAVGVLMLATPGPGLVVVPIGVLLLASEFKLMEDVAQQALDLVTRARRAYRRWRAK
jgi:hypothetical protein